MYIDRLLEPHWPFLLFLVDSYTHLLLTMGDDEFFSSSRVRVNPLTLDEVTSLSKQLLHITFPMYWQSDERSIRQRCVESLPITWEDARNRLTRCLQALHARE